MPYVVPNAIKLTFRIYHLGVLTMNSDMDSSQEPVHNTEELRQMVSLLQFGMSFRSSPLSGMPGSAVPSSSLKHPILSN